jgi:hypothetical protein
MEKELILLSDYCKHSRAELDFILALEDEGLIKTEIHNNIRYVLISQLKEMELFTRLHYDLSINIEGIDVIHNLLSKIELMEQELNMLRRRS